MIQILFPLLCLTALASDKQIFTLSDPRGDDSGAGEISYPSGADFERGDLDLLSFTAEKHKKGTWFEVRFANKVRTPAERTSKMSNVPMSEIARHDFYTLNVDVYIDTDQRRGSGRIATLPGRKIDLTADSAWEKAVILTPRPRLAEKWLKQQITKTNGGGKPARAAAKREVEAHYYFSDRIQVTGKTIRFFVPSTFLDGPARADWAYLVLVTGADPEQKMDLAFFRQQHSGLFMLPLGSGRVFETFQLPFDSDPEQPPIIDVLLPSKVLQQELLANYPVGGHAQLAAVSAAGEPYRKPEIQIEAHEETPKMAGPITETNLPHNRSAHALREPPQARANQQEQARQTQEPKRAITIAERLRRLDQLRSEQLISPEEYAKIRRKILADL